MTTIELRFVARRFHATPWGRHVNEGVPEWPPSPYRLLRALYDVWKRKHAEISGQAVASLLEVLASEPPRFRLPAAAASHTRSYLSSNSEDPTDKSLIFDAFVAAEGACYLTWPSLDISDEQTRLLDTLLGSLNFLGRSESWVDAKRVEYSPEGRRCEPADLSQESGELASVACAMPVTRYQGKKPWVEALAYSTTELRNDRRSSPPALWMVPYVRPENALMTHVPRTERRPMAVVQAVRLGLDSTVLPLVTGTIEVAEQIRCRLMGSHKKILGEDRVSRKFSGKGPDKKPLDDHSHVFILPQGKDQRINRVLIYTRHPDGFSADEVQAILGVRSLWQAEGRPDVRCVVTWKGLIKELKWKPEVVSKTPFVTVRHWRKGRGTVDEFLEAEVRRECRNHGLPTPVSIKPIESPGLYEWVEFRRNRKNDPPRPGYGFRLEFSEPVTVPFSLGYGCHYGLGQFDE